MRFGTPLPTIAFLKGSNVVFFCISRMMYTLWSGPRVAIVEIMTMIVAVVMAMLLIVMPIVASIAVSIACVPLKMNAYTDKMYIHKKQQLSHPSSGDCHCSV